MRVVLVLCLVALVGCTDSGGDNSAAPPSSPPPVSTPAPPPPVGSNPAPTPVPNPSPTGSPTLQGTVFKGPAQCTVAVTDREGTLLSSSSVSSDNNGAFVIQLSQFQGVAFITAENCSYINETTGATETGQTFTAAIVVSDSDASQPIPVSVTPLTTAAVLDAEAVAGSRANITPETVQASNARISESLGVPDLDIARTTPILSTDPFAVGTNEERSYGLLLAAISGIGNVSSVIDDMVSGLGADADQDERESIFDALLNGAVAFDQSGRNRSGVTATDVVAPVANGNAPTGIAPVATVPEDFFIGTSSSNTYSVDINNLGLFSDEDTQNLSFRVFDLPPGLSFDGTSVLSGTPDTPGNYVITVIALDGQGNAETITTPFNIFSLPTEEEAARFLLASSFGPTAAEIRAVSDAGYADWFQGQIDTPIRSILTAASPRIPQDVTFGGEDNFGLEEWYVNAVDGPDQLRQRSAFALSQVFVISALSGQISRYGHGFANYMDILQEGSFGNFRDLLEEVTYSPLMGIYLTYIGNERADPSRDTAPDENYAREVLQLFSIGLTDLNPDGTPVLDENGQPIETYNNDDITELAKVFTGLWWDGLDFQRRTNQVTPEIEVSRMVATESAHSTGEKVFLGRTVPAGGTTEQDITAALDIIFEHPNTAPFISKQLIQRITTSNPSPEYVLRVATAFETGAYRLPTGNVVGTGERGDLVPVWAAILFDPEAFATGGSQEQSQYGKVREPVVRLVHWLRVADVDRIDLTNSTGSQREFGLRDAHRSDFLAQSPFHSPSVFNFYRPGYVAPGSETADAGLVAPELQITNTTTTVGYQNFIRQRVFRDNSVRGLNGNYSTEIALAQDAEALTDHLDLLLTGGRMAEENKQRVRDVIESVSFNDSNRDERLRNRVQLAVQLVMTTPAFIIQN